MWCGTLFPEPALHVARAWTENTLTFHRIDTGISQIRYLSYQCERCPNTNRLHWQFFLQLYRATDLATVKRYLNSTRVHLQPVRGTADQARDYSMKDETRELGPWEHGTYARDGVNKNSSLTKAVKIITDGGTLFDVMIEEPEQVVKHWTGLQQLRVMNTPKRTWKPFAYIYWGPTGAGKSFKARNDNPALYKVPWPQGGIWNWQWYDGEEIVLFDEFSHQIKCEVLLQLLDYGEFPLNWKYGSGTLSAKKMVFTTNISPEEWYPGAKIEHRQALHRRMNEFCSILHFKTPIPKRDEHGKPLEFNITHQRMKLSSSGLGFLVDDPQDTDTDMEDSDIEDETEQLLVTPHTPLPNAGPTEDIFTRNNPYLDPQECTDEEFEPDFDIDGTD